MTSPTSSNAEQLIGINTKITNLQAQRATYIAATVSSLDIVGSTFGADILQPDATITTVAGIRSSPQFLPAVGNVVTLALSGAQIIYMPYGVAGGSIDSPQLSPTVNGTISGASTAAANAQTAANSANTTANNAQTTANAAQAAVGTKITTYYAGIAPSSGMSVGDLWINTGNNNTLYRWSGSAWVQVQDQQIQSALTAAGTAQATADGKVQTFYRATAPANPADNIGTGDLWIDTGHGNALYRWSGTAWVSVQDTSIQSALVAAQAAQATANTKVLVFAQPTQPTAQEVGDVWFDTDNGNKMFIWGPTPTVTRINYALNPSFESQAAGTVTTVSSWNNYTSGSNGTVTRSIVTTGGVTNASKAAKSSASSQAATAGVGHGFQQSSVAAQGDIYRVQATFQLATTGANFVPYIQVEWLNASNAVIGTVQNTSGSGTVTTNQLLSLTTTAAPALTTSARVTLQRRTAATTGTALATSDVTIDSVLIEKNRDAAAPTTYFDGNTLNNNDSVWGNPNGAPNSTSTIWQPGVTGVNGWQPQQLRTNAIQPQSILGNNCIAYGSITAPLLEAILVLAGTIVAGDPNADHAALMTDGLHLFRTVTGEGLQEVGKLAVGSFGTTLQFIDSSGHQVAQIDEAGNASYVSLNVASDPVFQGVTLSSKLFAKGGNMVASSYNDTYAISGITTEFGLGEISFIQDNARSYWIHLHMSHMYTNIGGTDALITLRYTTDGSTPTIASTIMDSTVFTMINGSSYSYTPPDIDAYGNFPAAGNGAKIRILATATSIAGGGSVNFSTGSGAAFRPFRFWAADMGPNISDTYLFNNGAVGGSVTSKTTYSTGNIAPSGHWTYSGGGVLRTDTTDVVQGSDPSGFNGDGKGGWNFAIPNISGTINGINLYIYTNWTYYNSGGYALIYPVTTANTAGPTALQSVWNSGTIYPKPGGVSVTLPSSWYASFKGKTSIGLYIGPSSLVGGAGNESYYIRADGPSARLSISYTQ